MKIKINTIKIKLLKLESIIFSKKKKINDVNIKNSGNKYFLYFSVLCLSIFFIVIFKKQFFFLFLVLIFHNFSGTNFSC